MADHYIEFKEHLAPALTAGVYKVSVTPTVTYGNIQAKVFKEPTNEDWIFVGGKRFRFDATDIDSVYPPANGYGEYARVLPHIVFHKSGLPWERTTGAQSKTKEHIPWLALLIFDQGDPAPTIQTTTIGALGESPKNNGVFFPKGFKPEPDEEPQTTCEVIEISKKLFVEIAPGIEDLPFLAHAREVDTRQKADGNISKEPVLKTYSVVVANRLPRVGKESIVHLVSFEDYGEILKNGIPSDCHSIRLISLRNWRFSSKDTGGSFLEHFEQLNNGGLNTIDVENTLKPFLLHLPFKDTNEESNVTALALLRQGFVPMEHKFRLGLKSISWYRGPLVPLKLKEFISPPFASPDALLIYDSNMGCYDVSYASAWQLGQLLGLKNKSFAKQLYFWKQKRSIADRKKLERDALSKKLPVISHSNKEGKEGPMLLPDFNDINEMVDKVNLNQPQAEHQSDDSLHADMKIHEGDPLIRVKAMDSFEVQEDQKKQENIISLFLEDLRTLKPVPYNYLIADPKMLPPESLKLFHIDPNWVAALVDGAMSLGDLLPDDPSFKKILLDKKKLEKKKERYNGFLLRSSIIKTWPGVEIWVRDTNKKEGEQVLDFVRHERLAEDLILSIVKGDITELEFRQPAEGLHFGVKTSEENSADGVVTFSKRLRTQGDTVLPDITTDIKGKVKVEDLAEKVGSTTSSHFGYVMVQSSAAVKIEIKPQ